MHHALHDALRVVLLRCSSAKQPISHTRMHSYIILNRCNIEKSKRTMDHFHSPFIAFKKCLQGYSYTFKLIKHNSL